MPDKAGHSMVELCRQIGTTYKVSERRFRQLSDDNLTATAKQENDKPDFLDMVIAKLSDLTGVKREDVADFIFRATKRQSWSEWKRRNGTIHPDISDVAQTMIQCDENGKIEKFISWMIETHSEKAYALRIASAVQPDPKAPYARSYWFKKKFKITADALSKHVERGNLARRKVGRWNEYSVPDARRIWPHLKIDDPPNCGKL